MEDEELTQVELRLRNVLRDNNLGWVLDQVDDIISQGVITEISASDMRSYSFTRERFTDDLFSVSMDEYPGAPPTKRRSRTAPALASRPLDPRERVEKIIDALIRVVTELPSIEQAAVKRLMDQSEGLPPVTSVKFVSDVESSESGRLLSIPEGVDDERHRSIEIALRSLREEINS